MKHMFTLEELEKDATLLLDLKEEVREEAETLGEVTNVVLYDVSLRLTQGIDRLADFPQKEPEGVMTIKFREPLSAQACIIVSALPGLSGVWLTLDLENERSLLRRSTGGGVLVRWQAAVQA